jgi:hypothetical protein
MAGLGRHVLGLGWGCHQQSILERGESCIHVCRAVLAEGPAIIYNVPGRTGAQHLRL